MALFYCNAFRWEELEGRASQTQPSFYCDKTPKAVAVRRRRPRPSAQASSCPAAGEKERTTRSKWKKHMWQKRERERVRTELQLWKVFFLQKFLLQQSSPSYSWNVPHFEKWLLLRVSSPAGVQTVEAGLTDVQRSGGWGSLTDGARARPKGAVTLSPRGRQKRESSLVFTAPLPPQNPTTVTYSHSSANPRRQRTRLFFST